MAYCSFSSECERFAGAMRAGGRPRARISGCATHLDASSRRPDALVSAATRYDVQPGDRQARIDIRKEDRTGTGGHGGRAS
jgi:hypothetical protein